KLPVPLFHLLIFDSNHHHPDLHSFPTRRSSDLSRPARRRGESSGFGLTCRKASRCWPARRHRYGSLSRRAPTARRCPSRARRLIDRKSTRLNSSHRTISYAVFCLKKKKTQIDTV